MKKRIGFILASIHTGSALNLWTTLAGEAERSGAAFFIFPGGRLDSRPDSEYLRNTIYRLANCENLDGLISWGSSIGGVVSMEELNRFHETLEPLPYVTIAHKMDGHPCVGFDAYTGFKSLVKHFIEVHGSKKIAFLRGPETHVSASDRYRAFLDACAESGLPVPDGSPLVSSPWPWSAGENAVIELCEVRKLVPGKDFDTLIGSSDMMVFSAVRYLQKSGYSVPQDFRVGGFNDSAESRILASPFSTVHMPYTELGLESFRMLRDIISPQRGPHSGSQRGTQSGLQRFSPQSVPGVSNGGAAADRILPAAMVIRESCGCRKTPGFPPAAKDRTAAGNRESLLRALTSLFRFDETTSAAVLEPILTAAFSRNGPLFFNLLERALVRFFEDDLDSGLLLDAGNLVRASGLVSDAWLAGIEKQFYLMISRVQGRVLSFKRYETAKRYATLNSLKCDLLGARDRKSLVSILASHLPEIGMHTAAIVLHENNGTSRFVGGFSPSGPDGGAASDSAEGTVSGDVFPDSHLLPARVMGNYAEGVFMVQPLFMENRPLGYFVSNVPFSEGPVFEELRSAISSALKGIFLFEETTQAKQAAENAERAKTEFFANAGNELCDPLHQIAGKLSELESSVSSGMSDPEVISEQLLFLKSQIASQIERTNRLIDLTLSGIDGLSFDNRLFRISEILPEAGVHPCLQGDPGRLAEAFALVRETFPDGIAVSDTVEGIVISFARKTRPMPEGGRDSEPTAENLGLLLAERIVLLQYGSFRSEPSTCTVTLSWPNLAGLPPVKSASPGQILLLPSASGFSPDLSSFGLPVVPYGSIGSGDGKSGGDGAGLAAGNALLAWSADGASMDDWMKVCALKHHAALFRSPVVCFSQKLAGKSLADVVERNVRKAGSGPILFIGQRFDHYSGWADDANSLSIQSIEELDGVVSETVPSLVVFSDIDIDAINAVRHDRATVLVPILVLPDHIGADADIAALGVIPRVVLCNRGVASSPEFAERVRAIITGEEMLPPHTGVLVKKAILYLNVHATSQIARWKLADTVNVSEDYLTRIFHRETGFSLWEYLTRYRVFLATELLLHTNDTIYEVALKTGFQDQAYFCRVFKKIHGIPPGKMRTK